MSGSTKAAHQWMAEFMAKVSAIGKDGSNSHHNYAYRSIDQIINDIGVAMREMGITMSTAVKDIVIAGQDHYVVRMGYTLYSPDGQVMAEFEAIGSGRDGQDKGAYKAMSGALKYAFGHGMMIPFEFDDPDATGSAEPPPSGGPMVDVSDAVAVYNTLPPHFQSEVDQTAAANGLSNWQAGVPQERAAAFRTFVQGRAVVAQQQTVQSGQQP